MFKKAMRKLKRVTQKNLNRFQARRAISRGMFKEIDVKSMEELRSKFDDHSCRKCQDRFEHSLIRNAERAYKLQLTSRKVCGSSTSAAATSCTPRSSWGTRRSGSTSTTPTWGRSRSSWA